MKHIKILEEFINENSESFINKGNKLKELHFINRDTYITVKYYNGSFGKNTSFIIYKSEIDEVIDILKSMK